jgi:hypothetical protein
MENNAYGEALAAPELCRPDAPPLDPNDVKVFVDPHGFLRATVGDRTYLDVTITRAFPLTHSDKYVCLLSGRLSEIGVIKDINLLEEQTRAIVQEQLERRYYLPRIDRIVSIREEFGATYWLVETDHGQRNFVGKGVRDNVQYVSSSRIIIQDVDGNRYEVPDINSLDSLSRSLLFRVT